MTDSRRRSSLARLASFLGGVIGVAGVVFVARTLATRWDEVSEAFSGIDLVNLVGSLFLGLGAMTLIGWVWTSMIRSRGHEHERLRAMSWYFTGQLGKYVPGGIWPIVGRAEMAARSGVPRTDAYASTGLSLVTTYLAAAVAIVIGSLVSGQRRLIGGLLACGLVVGYVVFSNRHLRTRALALIGKVTPNVQSLTDPRRLARLTIAHVPAWLMMSLSTSVTASAFGARIGVFDMLFVTSASWLVGFVVIGVPGGIGVREAMFTSLAGGIVGTPVAVSLALASRVVFIAVDLVGALAANVLARVSGTTRAGRGESPCADR